MYACIEGGNIEDVNDRAAIGIISEPIVARCSKLLTGVPQEDMVVSTIINTVLLPVGLALNRSRLMSFLLKN